MLTEKPGMEEWRIRKSELLNSDQHTRTYFLNELSKNSGVVSMIASNETYPLLAGTQPNLYRSFMCQVWSHTAPQGMAGLIHPDTHLEGVKEGFFRAASYRHLRLHATFINSGNWAFEIGRTVSFGLHIYGGQQEVDFISLSQLHNAQVLPQSLAHDGNGEAPTQKHNGDWDVRPHRTRIIRVQMPLLTEWNRLGGESTPPEQAPLLHPITKAEQGAISSLANAPHRLATYSPQISRGYDESTARKRGVIRYEAGLPSSWDEVILQGSHFSIATPFAKQPNNPMRNGKDWVPWKINEMPSDSIPRTTCVRATSNALFEADQDKWSGRRYSEYYRLAWRAMIDPKSTERSLFAAIIPPGPTHVNAVHSLALADNHLTVLNAGFWAALPLDYLLRITGRSHLQVGEAQKMPAPAPDHPLAPPLLLRTLRLNVLTSAYAPLWRELFHPTWPGYECWANPNWPGLNPLAAHLTPDWEPETPLRTEYERRAALIELDALVSVWLSMTADQLVAIYRSRYAVLAGRESAMYFDASGRRLTADPYAYGHGQTKQDYIDLLAHLENPDTTPPPAGYTAPFYKADREAEMRAAHAHFRARLDKEIAAGRWTPPEIRKA
jgi:hypothetical protein